MKKSKIEQWAEDQTKRVAKRKAERVSSSLDGLVRKQECCNVCGCVVEGTLCEKTKYLNVVYSKKCGCKEAIKRLCSKMGCSHLPSNK